MKYLIGFHLTFSFVFSIGGEWSTWSTCSATCQSSLLVSPYQTRSCNVNFCSGQSSQICNFKVPCPGTLSDWTDWEDCSATCQMDLNAPKQTSTRTCLGGSFSDNCGGAALYKSQNCSVNVYCPGTVSKWSSWSTCSATCNNLYDLPFQFRSRSCENYSTWNLYYAGCTDGRTVSFTMKETVSCNTKVGCPGTYDDWGSWSSCSKTCKSDLNSAPFQNRNRKCRGDSLGVGCDGPSYEVKICNFEISCPEKSTYRLWYSRAASIGKYDAGVNQCLRVCLVVIVLLSMHVFS